jgi:hypothetical protein
MEELNEMLSPTVNSDWSEPAKTEEISTTANEVILKAKAAKNVFLNEAKNLLPNVTSVITDSVARLDVANRPISFIPNSLLFYGSLTFLGVYLTKKFL